MERNFIFVFILFATLSNFFMINAIPLHKRDTVFNKCPLDNTPTLTVAIVPDPIVAKNPVSFFVTGILNNDVTPGNTLLAIGFADSSGKKSLKNVYYQVFTEPFKAGTTMKIVAPKVPTPKKLPEVYTIGVVVGDQNPGDPVEPIIPYGCTYAVVGTSSGSDVQISGNPFAGINVE